ncbi:MAG TPA: 4-alpha-glucanotransferase [Nitrospira sp.]|nr:4-alpha-glucanotransferase [Nitrospira sp.]
MKTHQARRTTTSRSTIIDHHLHQLATECGVATSYIDEVGDRRQVSDESLRQVLSVMGVAAQSALQVKESMQEIRSERWAEMLEPVMVVSMDRLPHTFTIRLPMAADHVKSVAFLWKLEKEQGGTLVGQSTGARAKIINREKVERVAYCEVALPLPRALPLGYHSLTVDVRGPGINRRAVMILAVVPAQSYLHPAVKGSRRTWGLTIQLYGLRSAKNWGVGDFRDLREIVRWVGRELGADLLGVNPLHALPPETISPYSPSSRLFHHPLYLDIEGIPEFRELASIQATVQASIFQAKLAALRRSQFVQYAAVTRMKQQMLERLFLHFQRRHLTKNTSRARAFHRFVRDQGEALQRFALFRVLEEQMRGRRTLSETGPQGWRTWPTKYQHPDSPAVTKIAARYQSRVQLFQYIEWQCQQQLHAVQSAAKRVGMAIGLYKDMAGWVSPGGAHVCALLRQKS